MKRKRICEEIFFQKDKYEKTKCLFSKIKDIASNFARLKTNMKY